MEPARQLAPDAAQQPAVLIVDDDRTMRELFSVLLQRAALGVTCVSSADEARSHLHRHTPDLILLDVQLGETDGSRFAKELTTGAQGEPIPVVMVSASRDAAVQERAQQAGCAGFIHKPINPRTFAQDVGQYVRRRPRVEDGDAETSGKQDAAFTKLRKEFIAEALGSLGELDARDNEALLADGLLAGAAHRWAGASRIEGLPNVEEAARAVETLAKERRTDQIGRIRDDLRWIREQFEEMA